MATNNKTRNAVLKFVTQDSSLSSWYKTNGATLQLPVSPLSDLLAALNTGIGAVSVLHEGATAQDLQSSNILSPEATQFLNDHSYSSTKPKAYLNWILFDEQFKYVSSSSGADQVGSDNSLTVLGHNGLPIDKNGYLYVYVSNETPNLDVFFDNLQVTHIRGRVLEESHYYPFGLTMAGISSQAVTSIPNCGCGKKGYNSNEIQNKEFTDGSGLEVYDFNARTYDQQIGRFIQIDPLLELGQESLTPYQFGFNDPTRYNDPDGKCPWCVFLLPAVVEAIEAALVTSTVVVAADQTGKGLKQLKENYDNDRLNSQSSGSSSKGAEGSRVIEHPSDIGVDGQSNSVDPSMRSAINYAKAKEIKIDPENKVDRETLNPPSREGNAPTFKKDGKSVEIHHEGQSSDGPFKEMHPQDHRGKGNFKKNHSNTGQQPSKIDRKEWNKQVREYWKKEYEKKQAQDGAPLSG